VPTALSTLDVSSVLAANTAAQPSLATGTTVRVVQGKFAQQAGVIIGANHGYYQIALDTGELANAYRKNLEIESADGTRIPAGDDCLGDCEFDISGDSEMCFKLEDDHDPEMCGVFSSFISDDMVMVS